jgi:hypothetical protein
LKDISASFIDGVKNCTDLNILVNFGQLSLKMLGLRNWLILHVEKDQQVLRLGKTITITKRNICIYWEVALDLSELFRGKIFVLFSWLGLVFITLCLLFLYNFWRHLKNCQILLPLCSLLLLWHLCQLLHLWHLWHLWHSQPAF